MCRLARLAHSSRLPWPTQSVSREQTVVLAAAREISQQAMQTRSFVVLSLSTAAALQQLSRRDLAQAIGIGAAHARA